MKKTEIVRNVKDKLGIDRLNEMQQQMLDTDKRDIILLAPTGSGKTLAFTLRMLRNIDLGGDNVSALSAVVIAPSRELVIQLADVVRAVASGLKTVAMYGGHSMSDEVNTLSVTPNIIISTPGRLVDHINRHTVDLTNVKSVILDEYDKSLELGFTDEMRKIVKKIRRPSLKMLTSATPLADFPDFMGQADSYHIFNFSSEVTEPEATTRIIAVDSPAKDKLETLSGLLRSLDNQKVIIFVNHRESAERVFDRLKKEGFPVGLYHGGLEQHDRRMAVELLSNATTPILVATDLASRGLDIAEVGSVIHYHNPLSAETWKHRNGRTARQGASGNVYVILSPGEEMPEGSVADETVSSFTPSTDPIRSDVATIYFNAGKKEKLSKGDIAGFLIQKGGLAKEEVGTISVDDHHAIAAVPRSGVDDLLKRIAPERIKNKRVRITLLS